ncbi:MAG: restriction endonuclease subunit S [Clostridia bacterium]|nr:restriction endonuclease subunit S [Clostridia bacterium]
MRSYKISEIADIQSGLVLSRKAAKENMNIYPYQRLTLRSVTEDCLLDISSFETYEACAPIDEQFLTKENDIIVRLFAPVCATLITKDYEGLVVPSQLAIIRLKDSCPYLPGYLSVYLTNERSLENLIEGAGMAAQKIIKVGNVAELEIPCLPIEKQKMISDIANEQLNIVALYKKIIEQEALRTKTVIKDIIGGKR